MRHLLFSLAILALLTGCGSGSQETADKESNSEKDAGKEQTASEEQNNEEAEQSTGQFGAEIDESGIMQFAAVQEHMEDTAATHAKLSGKITSVCQKKGCWMKVALDGGADTVMVRFKDYDFFVPKNSAGNEVVMDGRAFIDTMSVEMRRHYAKDAGKSEEEIKKITEPKAKLAFEANGVIIK